MPWTMEEGFKTFRLIAEPVYQVRMDGTAWQLACSSGSDAEQVLNSFLVGAEKRIEHRCYKHGASFVGFEDSRQPPRVRLVHGRTKCIASTGGVAKLLSQLNEGSVLAQIALALLDGVAKDFVEAEVLKDRYNIGKSLVERENIVIGGFEKIPLQPVCDCVRDLMGDDVMRQT